MYVVSGILAVRDWSLGLDWTCCGIYALTQNLMEVLMTVPAVFTTVGVSGVVL